MVCLANILNFNTNAIFIFLMVFSSWIVAETSKIVIHSWKKRRFQFKWFFSYGGMPSAHTAFVTSLCFSVLIVEGFGVTFLISLALAILVLRDLVGIRKKIDEISEKINALLGKKNKEKIENISHNMPEIIVGMSIGIIVPIIVLILAKIIL